MATELRLRLRADLTADARGQHRVAATVGPAGEALVLLTDKADAGVLELIEEHLDWVSFPHTRVRRPVRATLLQCGSAGVHRSVLPDLTVAFPILQPLPNGEFLVVGARCSRLEDQTVERNAHVYAADSTLLREFTLGDGIEDVQTTTAGTVWVSYFDEGVFGSLGVGAAGLVHFDAYGTRLWEYTPPPGLGIIDDCYALNVAEDAVWAYYYMDFPLVRVTPLGEIRAWHSDIAGARAFATDGRLVLFFGGYGPDAFRCVLGSLGDTMIEDIQERTLVFPDGRPVTGRDVVGRGSQLHVFDDTGWYQLDVRELS